MIRPCETAHCCLYLPVDVGSSTNSRVFLLEVLQCYCVVVSQPPSVSDVTSRGRAVDVEATASGYNNYLLEWLFHMHWSWRNRKDNNM